MRRPYKAITPEGLLTKSVRRLLSVVGILHYKAWQGPMSAPGVSDIIGCYKGRFIAIELKAGKGKASDAQLEFIRRVNEAGGIGFVAYDLDTVIEKLGLEDRFLFKGKI